MSSPISRTSPPFDVPEAGSSQDITVWSLAQPRHLGVGCILLLPRWGVVPVYCENTECKILHAEHRDKWCTLRHKGWKHPLIVLRINPRMFGDIHSGFDITFAKVRSFTLKQRFQCSNGNSAHSF